MDEEYIQVGDILADKYHVQSILGRGGMGMVVSVWHNDLREHRAIKFLLPHAARDRESVERFMREARAATSLQSTHAVKVYDIARLADGVPYIVMEYLEGQDLDGLLRTQGPLPVAEACGYLLQACEAIGEAHEKGIVHRDLKPANLFVKKGLRGEPFVKVLDFGIAKLTAGMGGANPSITSTQSMMGTPAYMSPEQILTTKLVDARGDIWSLGVILYEITTGNLPFMGDIAPVIFAKILDDREIAPPPSVHNPALSPEFDAMVLRCLERTPSERYQNIAEFVEALTPFAFPAIRIVPPPRPSAPQFTSTVPMRPSVPQFTVTVPMNLPSAAPDLDFEPDSVTHRIEPLQPEALEKVDPRLRGSRSLAAKQEIASTALPPSASIDSSIESPGLHFDKTQKQLPVVAPPIAPPIVPPIAPDAASRILNASAMTPMFPAASSGPNLQSSSKRNTLVVVAVVAAVVLAIVVASLITVLLSAGDSIETPQVGSASNSSHDPIVAPISTESARSSHDVPVAESTEPTGLTPPTSSVKPSTTKPSPVTTTTSKKTKTSFGGRK